jgi:hypothetical protein
VVSKSFLAILFLVLAVWLTGCAAIAPERKTSPANPKILEEDVTNDHGVHPGAGGETPPGVDESHPSAEGESPAVQPEHRSPGRFKPWRDKTGAIKGWERETDRTRDREP